MPEINQTTVAVFAKRSRTLPVGSPRVKRSSTPTARSSLETRALTARLHRAEGQVRAVARLIEAGEPCEAVAQQLTAARRALDRAFFALVGCAVEHGEVAPDEVAALLAKYA
jgi:CsoR family transcriptional regulator, copper-sensing transcriptional repressor